jgi:hypothetical protein
MNNSVVSLSAPAIPREVQDFALQNDVRAYLNAVIELTRQAFPSSEVFVTLGQDAEDERHQYIALDVNVGDRSPDELLAGQRIWSGGLGRVCPSRYAVYFVLGWR